MVRILTEIYCVSLVAILAVSSSLQLSMTSKSYNDIAILWDVDGTLSDSYLLGFSSTQKVLEKHGFNQIDEKDYHAGTKYTTPRRLAWHAKGDTEHPIGELLGKEFDELYVQLVSTETALFYPGISELLDKICKDHNNLKLGALSNACGAYVRAVLKVNKVDSMFSVGLGADEVEEAKPSPKGLIQLCKQMSVNPKNCIYIGDSPTDGMAAEAAGMRGIGVTWGSHPVETVGPAFSETVHSVDELEKSLYNSIKIIKS